MSKRLEGKVAVITGAASGIGAATAQRVMDCALEELQSVGATRFRLDQVIK